jgi:CRISP-associated protein Cas1
MFRKERAVHIIDMKEVVSLKLIINTPGAYINKVNDRFQVKVGEQKVEYSCKKVEQILVSTAVLITTDALQLAVENNIDIVFLQYNGHPFARVWHSKLGSITTIRRNQLKLTESLLGTQLVKEWIGQKLQNQISHLEKLKANRTEEKVAILEEAIESIKNQQESIKKIADVTIAKVRNTMEGHEGTAGRIYFSALGKVIPEQYAFEGRSKNPARDMFNCMLNYAYGILYSNIEKTCIIAGLDPYIGIMHTDNYNKTALVFDLIEMYRGYMDEVVFKLFSKRQVKKDMFDEVEGGLWLNKEGKVLLIGAVNDRVAEKIKYKGRNIELNNIIQYDCHAIANRILEEVSGTDAGVGSI